DAASRHANSRALVGELNEVFATRDYEEWCERFKSLEGVWAPIQSPAEVLADPQALENGFISSVDIDEHSQYQVGVSPAQFDEQPIGRLMAGPGFGEHTDEVLREIGLTDAQLRALRDSGAIR
ncbi:CoA transferase, partial [Buttiauxella gaviniae]|uniref:CoA transferase n=1 Tax=Buttiauxella gaviniae TaxID=82990 RepID=UPI003BB50B05